VNVSSTTIELLGLPLDALSARDLLNRIESDLTAGRGGWVVTANVDILRHFLANPVAKEAYLAADVRVADGMPLVWASRLRGEPLPERVAGSSLCVPLLEMCQRRGWQVTLLGGAPGSAERVAESYAQHLPGLTILGNSALRFSAQPGQAELEAANETLTRHASEIVLVGLGSPKQEIVIQQLRKSWPATWFIGVGGSFSFLAGDIKRAPRWMQKFGLEWVHRLATDPMRLGPRYLRDDLPIGVRLVADAIRSRMLGNK
jgi:N-acetylglucosaminyldiphosphoundecaprenol N-acetyl-beta-D-mannosaminyltransferase